MERFIVTVSDESKALNPSELADFLYLFRATNLALRHFVTERDHASERVPLTEEVESYRKRLETFFDPRNAPDCVQIMEIRRQSPVELVLGGCAFLLVLGVIFSGGKVSVGLQGVKAQLPPFGKGLQSLKQALGLDKNLKVGFGIRPTTIKLNKTEYDEMCRQDDASRNKGGFQHFLVGLKYRVNKQTRELVLSERDLERIYRYKANPGKGGWQSRFKKIFERHFPDDHAG